MQNHPDLDEARATLDMLAAGDPNELAELIAIVRDSLASGAASLAGAVEAEDRKQVHFHSHTLKGALRTAGMEHLAALVEDIELGAARLAVPELRTRASEIRGRVAVVVDGLAP